jgi:hypothetical protein
MHPPRGQRGVGFGVAIGVGVGSISGAAARGVFIAPLSTMPAFDATAFTDAASPTPPAPTNINLKIEAGAFMLSFQDKAFQPMPQAGQGS